MSAAKGAAEILGSQGVPAVGAAESPILKILRGPDKNFALLRNQSIVGWHTAMEPTLVVE